MTVTNFGFWIAVACAATLIALATAGAVWGWLKDGAR